MNREDIIRMAQEAGFFVSLDCKISGFEAFAALVASAERPWVGLTDEEILIMSRYDLGYAALIGEVQRKLKEKNNV